MGTTFLQRLVLILLFIVTSIGLEKSYAKNDSKVRLEGELEIMIEDYANGTTKERKYLKSDKKRIELKGELPKKLKSGDKIRVKGSLKNTVEMLVESGSTEVLALAALPATMGDQKVAVFLVNFADDTSQPISAASAQTLIFTTMNNYYKEASFQQTSISGDVFGYFTVSQSKTVCDVYAMANEVANLAIASGVNLSAYTRRMYMFPRNSCGWAGLANVGGTNTNAWLNGSFVLLTAGHEFGHNLGLHHAHALDCDVSPLGNTCTSLAYGDAADIMGNNKAGHFNPFEKQMLGWLGASQVLVATNSNRFFIEPYSSSNLGPKAVKVLLGNGKSYYVEYRQLIGFDSVLTLGNLVKGVMVRKATDGDGESSYQLDMSPGSATSSYSELADGALNIGQTFRDPAADVNITLVSADASGATIDVSYGALPSDTTPPTVSLTSPLSGSTLSGTITVSANASDNAAVSRVEFFVDGALVSADASSSYGFSYNTALLANGSHIFAAQAVDSSNNKSVISQASVNISNSAPDITPPTVSLTAPSNGSTVSGSIIVSASASDNVSVNHVDFFLDGNVFAGDYSASYAVSYDTTRLPNGSHSFAARAVDSSGNASIISQVSVTVSNGVADTIAPSVPASLTAAAASCSQINLAWSASSDTGGSGLKGYNVYASSGALLRMVTSTSTSMTGLSGNTSYSYQVAAIDNAGNISAKSNVAAAITSACPVADATAPLVSINSPASGAYVSPRTVITISSSASDNIAVTRVDTLVNGVLLCAQSGSVGSCSWKVPGGKARSQSIEVRAYDAAGNMGKKVISVINSK